MIRTPVAPFAGLVDTTRGGVDGTVSLPHPLAKVRETESNATKSPVIPSLRVNILIPLSNTGHIVSDTLVWLSGQLPGISEPINLRNSRSITTKSEQ